jgi:TolB-like protein/Flp pilus assembly protein TadD
MSLISELKRRSVFQVAVAYTVVSWLLMQVADILFPAFGLPDWVMRGLILLLLIGFPIAVALAWIFDLTPQGVRRTDEMRESGESPPVRSQTLNIVIIGVLAAAVLLFTLDKFIWKTDPALITGGKPEGKTSIAVLPFANMSGDPVNDPFTAGMHDDLLTQLSKISALETASRTSVRKYRDGDQSIPEIALELKVHTVVEGGVQRSDDRLRINVQLIDGQTDKHLWAETYDRQLSATNIFAIQSEMAKAIAASLKAALLPSEEQAIDKVPTRNLAAYDAYAEGRHNLDIESTTGLATAAEQFKTATRLDPGFAAAWAGRCEAQRRRFLRTSDQALFEGAERACTQALTLDPDQVEVLIALGGLYRTYGEYSKAEASLQRALFAKAEQTLDKALSINDIEADTHIEMGLVYASQGRLIEAEAALLRAAELNPSSWSAQSSLFLFYYTYDERPGRIELAIRHAELAMNISPDNPSSWNNLGSAYFMSQDYDRASEAWGHSLALEPTRTGYTNTGVALHYAGRFTESAEMQRKATEMAPDDHRPWGRLGDSLSFVDGQSDSALRAYRKAIPLARANLRINDKDWRTWGLLATYLAHSGEQQEALAAASEALEHSEHKAEALYYAAQVYLAGNDMQASFDALEQAVDKDATYRPLIAVDEMFAALRADERFQNLIQATPSKSRRF